MSLFLKKIKNINSSNKKKHGKEDLVNLFTNTTRDQSDQQQPDQPNQLDHRFSKLDIYDKFILMNYSTDTCLDRIIKILAIIEKTSIDKKLLRYIYKLKINRNKVKYYRLNLTYCKINMVQSLVLSYDKCFVKCHKIINNLNKNKSEYLNDITLNFRKIKDNDIDNIYEETKLQLFIDRTFFKK